MQLCSSLLGPHTCSCAMGAWSDESSDEGPWGDWPSGNEGPCDTEEGPWAQVDRAARQPSKRSKKVVFNAACVNMPEADWEMLKEIASKPGKQQKREARGQSADAVLDRYRGPGRCSCAGHTKHGGHPCHRDLDRAVLLATCRSYWTLPPLGRAFLVNSFHSEAKEQSGLKRVTWHMGETRLCFTNFCHLLGVGTCTIRQDIGSAGRANASLPRGPRAQGNQTSVCDFFFQEIYQSAAESLPAPSRSQGVEASGCQGDADISFDNKPWLDAGDPLWPDGEDSWCPDRPAVDVSQMLTVAADGKDIGLPMRFLGHNTLHALYWCFRAHWSALQDHGSLEDIHGRQGRPNVGAECPSFSTFRRRWDAVWSYYLKFRKSSQHAQCDTCFKLQQVIEDRKGNLVAKWNAATELRQHYRDTYLDRQIYWNLRLASRSHGNVLTLIIDSMDKAKFAWPRWSFAVRPHELADLRRPRAVFTASWAHGYCCDLYMANESVNHGSDAFLEVLCQTIQRVKVLCVEQGRPFPEHLVIQSDNTVAQAKNQHVMLFLAWLVHKRYFMTATLNFMVVGHTHEDVGNRFAAGHSLGLVCSLVSLACPCRCLGTRGRTVTKHASNSFDCGTCRAGPRPGCFRPLVRLGLRGALL